MQIIIDANPIISMLIKPGKPLELLLREELSIVAPAFLFEEIENNLEIIVKKSKLTKEEVVVFLSIIKQLITIIPEEEFFKYKEKAENICPDVKDAVYFALALYLKCPIWSNEKILKRQDHVIVYATHELMELYNI